MINDLITYPTMLPRAAKVARMSWDSESKSDSTGTTLGEKDLHLLLKLVRAGSDHSASLRQVVVHCRITASRGWWQQFAKYRIGVEMYSQSTMHTGTRHHYTTDDFLDGLVMQTTLDELNRCASEKNLERLSSLLPEGFLQTRAVMMSYPAMRAMYHSRKAHRRKEWRQFCVELESLPYSELITA